MGTDISMYAEKREGGLWKSCFPVESLWDGETIYEMETVYDNDRNYELFRILADVDRMRNQGFDPIAPPRGLPNDLSPELRQLVVWEEETGAYCHNHSWLLLREVLEIPWKDKTRTVTGFVDLEQYVTFKEKGQPDQFTSAGGSCGVGRGSHKSGGFSIANYVLSLWRKTSPPEPAPTIVTNEEMEQFVRDGKLSNDVITEIALQFSYADYCQVFLQQTVPLLKTFGKPDDVRIVFWFDS